MRRVKTPVWLHRALYVRLLMMPVVSMTSASMPTYRPINYTIYITTCYEIVELHGNCLYKYITSHLQTLNMFFFFFECRS